MSAQSTLNIHKLERVDESFYFDKKSFYDLALRFDGNYFQAVAFSRDRFKFVLQAEFHLLDGVKSYKEVLQRTDFLQRDFEKVVFVNNSQKFAIIPLAFNSDKISDAIMNMQTERSIHEMEYSSNIPLLDSKVDFTIDTTLLASIRNQFPSVKMIHQSSSIFNYIENTSYRGLMMFIHINTNSIDVALMHNTSCLLYNQYSFGTPEEMIYYPLYIAEQYNIKPENLSLVLFGRVAEDNEYTEIVKNYFNRTMLAPKDQRFQYAHRIEEHSSMSNFTTLYTALSCV